MSLRWLSTHRSVIATATSATIITALVAAVAIVSTGFTAQRLDLGDGSIWVANAANGMVGRANPQILALDSVVATTGGQLEVVQAGPTVLLVNRLDSTVQIVDAATSAVVTSVALPATDPDLHLADNNVVISSGATGDVWIMPIVQLASFDAQSSPLMNFGAHIVTSVDPSGELFIYSAATSMVSRIDAAQALAGSPGGARPDLVASETPVAEWRTRQQQASDLLAAEQPGVDKQAVDKQAADKQAADKQAADPQTGNQGATGPQPTGTSSGRTSAKVTITSVAGQWALLDSANRVLVTPSGSVPLAAQLTGTGAPVLQRPSTAGGGVLVSSSSGMLEVSMKDSSVSVVVKGARGSAAAPVALGGCIFAAWASSTLWRKCGQSPASELPLDSLPPAGSRLQFAINGDRVVLNDTAGGGIWAVQRSGELIDNWSQLMDRATDPTRLDFSDADVAPTYDLVQKPPIATDDALGARPGRATTLPVLLNDFDPNGDPIAITAVTPIQPNVGRLDVINNGQQLVLALTDSARGTVTFSYSISDGRGGSASANVSVTARLPAENSAPVQVRVTGAALQAGGRVTTEVLGDWIDPDGDAFYLASATTAAPDSVVSTPEGSVVFADGTAVNGVRKVSLSVSDAIATATGTLNVTVGAFDRVPIVLKPFVEYTYAGQEVTVSPLEHASGGNGALHLTSVPAKNGAAIVTNLERATFRFSSTEVGTHYVEFVVSDSTNTATGRVRIEVTPPPETNVRPVTIPKTVFITPLGTRDLDIADSDYDPAGGVLLVTSFYNLSEASGVTAVIVNERSLRVTLGAPLLSGPVRFNYRVTNGLAEAQGTVTVIEIAKHDLVQAPIARDDSVTARVGDAIDIAVLDNDIQPDGSTVTLDPRLVTSGGPNSGLLFVSGSVLRFLAPTHTGDFTATYQIANSSGQTAQASVTIAVREPLLSTNTPPVPLTVTARVFAGQTVRIAIALNGIDPNGDSVSLLGLASNPERGSVTAVGDNYFDYLAGDYSAGTDQFGYTVVDALGARAVGTIRVGISAQTGGARNPVANADEVTIRPGGQVSVRVLDNDSNPDGGFLTVIAAEPSSRAVVATIDGDIVTVSPPARPGRYGVVYTIENSFGGTASAFLTVNVRADAPRAYPVVRDSVLTLADVLGRTTIDVDVLSKVFFADGRPGSLSVSVLPGYSNDARVRADKSITVPVLDSSQIIPFAVSHPDDLGIVSYALIRIPGLRDSLPQINPSAPPLTVVSGSALTIDLNRYLLAVGGRKVTLFTQTPVTATRSDLSNLVVNDHTLRFVSAEKYFGPASIAFDVTDSVATPNTRIVTVVLPITVTPSQNQPPVFIGGVIDFEPGSSRVLELLRLTDYPYPKDVAQLKFEVLSPLPVGFSYLLTGQTLTLTANAAAKKGAMTSITIAVRDSRGGGVPGSIRLGVVASSRPLAQPATDSAFVPRGTSVSVDVLANDEATNPFPGQQLSVLAIRGLEGAALPSGLTIFPSPDRKRLMVSASAATPATVLSLQYQVADATDDPDRFVWGTITVSVQDVPNAVTDITITAFGDRSLTVRFNPGASNNSAITGYTIAQYSRSGTEYSSTQCAGTVCTIPTRGNGPDNGVRLQVSATNAVGSSIAAESATIVYSDVVPAAPEALSAEAADGALRISWNPVATPAGGSAVENYQVTAANLTGTLRSADCSIRRCTLDIAGLTNGQVVSVSAVARNAALPALAKWNSSTTTGTPAGKPVLTGSVPVAVSTGNVIDASWPGVFADNGSAISGYTAVAYTATAPTCQVPRPFGSSVVDAGTATSAVFSRLATDSEYRVMVLAKNVMGCEVSAAVLARTSPGIVTAIDSAESASPRSTHDFSLAAAWVGATRLGKNYNFYYRLSGGSVSTVSSGPVAFGGLLTAEETQYGQLISVEVRACRSYPDGTAICQPEWSKPFVLGVPVDPRVDPVSFTVTDAERQVGTFNWSRWPTAPDGNYSAIQYACESPAVFVVADTTRGGSCTTAAAAGGKPTLTIRVTANQGKTYDISYDQAGNVR